MLGIGPWEIALIVIAALLLIGPRKLPQIMKSVGKGLFELRKASSEFRRTLEHEVTAEDRASQDERIMAERMKYMAELQKQQEAATDAATSGAPEATAPDTSNGTNGGVDAPGVSPVAEAAVPTGPRPDAPPAKAPDGESASDTSTEPDKS